MNMVVFVLPSMGIVHFHVELEEYINGDVFRTPSAPSYLILVKSTPAQFMNI